MIRSAAPQRRYAILAEGRFADSSAKTAHGLIRYGKDEVVCVMDSTLAGERVAEVLPDLGRDAPIVGTLEEALELSPTSVLVGLAPAGGRLPEEWMEIMRDAAEAGLEIVSGLHQRLAPEFVPTGQTGIVIAGWGICVDAVVSDFVAGASEQLVLEAARTSPDLILVEGQGSLGHPAYSGVSLGLMHGSCPDCLILCAGDPYEEVSRGAPPLSPARVARLYEEVASLIKPAPVVAVSLNTRGLDKERARELTAAVADETGLPTADPFRGSATPILQAVLDTPKSRPTGKM